MANNKTQSDEDSLWQALLYVQGDMSVDDTEAFEQKMLHDTELCEKVAGASLLSSAVMVCGHGTAVVPTRPDIRQTGLRSLAVIVTGCCCAALIMFIAGRSLYPHTVYADATDGKQASLLVAAWIDGADTEEELQEQDTDSTIDTELIVPDWMLAGISELNEDSRDGSEAPQQNGDSRELL